MTFLPIVERELRVAARRSATFWLRVIAAVAAVAIAVGLFTIFVSLRALAANQSGGPLFTVLSWMSFLVALSAGLFFTSDALSEEKREGTLGFLFLTDLRGYDVVLGKLIATSCRCVFALLAIFPVLAFTQLLGGVAGGEFWRVILVLLHALFFSLAAGMFVSSVSQHPQKALAAAVTLLFILIGGSAAMDGFMAYIDNHAFQPRLSLVSPFTAFLNCENAGTLFWTALGASHGTAWVLLIAACLFIPRTWQERGARPQLEKSSVRSWWRFGSARRRQLLRSVVMDRHPMTWVACRDRWPALIVWGLVLLTVTTFVGCALGHENGFWGWAGWSMMNFAVSLILYLWVASQATQLFAELRRSGMIELLLATPLKFDRVALGAWLGLARLFAAPILIIVVVQLFAALATSFGGGVRGVAVAIASANEIVPQWLLLGLTAFSAAVISAANFIALSWFGLWVGLTSRNGLLATLKTIVYVQIIPWLVINFASAMIIPLLGFLSGWGSGNLFKWFPLVMLGFSTLLTLAKDLMFWAFAWRRLGRDFRTTATKAVSPIVIRATIPPLVTAAPRQS